MSIRIRVWQDGYRRVIPTGDGPMVSEPGETVMVIVGRKLDAKALAALHAFVATLGDTELIQ